MASQFSRTTRALATDSARFPLVTWLAAAACLAAWLGWFAFGSVTVWEVSKRARLEVTQASHGVAALRAGKLAVSHLELGREVAAGEVLFELDARAEQLRLDEETVRLEALPLRIASLRREIAALEDATAADQRSAQAASQTAQARASEAGAAVDFARENERRLKEESGTGSVAEIEALRALSEARRLGAARDALTVDVRRLELDARTRAHQARAQIEALRRAVVGLEGEASTGRTTIARLQLDIERHRVRAPVAGTIGEVLPIRPGSHVAEGERLATIVPRGELAIVAEFNPATALGRVRNAQRARLTLDGFPWTQYGTVTAQVARVGGEIRDGMLRVELVPTSGAPAGVMLQHGLTGVVEVGLEEVAPAILVLRVAGQMLKGGRTTSPPPATPTATSGATTLATRTGDR